jgi:hypothetical protein
MARCAHPLTLIAPPSNRRVSTKFRRHGKAFFEPSLPKARQACITGKGPPLRSIKGNQRRFGFEPTEMSQSERSIAGRTIFIFLKYFEQWTKRASITRFAQGEHDLRVMLCGLRCETFD